MSAKRAATSKLNHDNWNDEEEPEEAGTFKVASEEELKKRVIKKARRKTGSENENKNVFASFAGFKDIRTTNNELPFSFLNKSSIDNEQSNSESVTSNNSNSEDSNITSKELEKLRNFNKEFVNWLKTLIDKNPEQNLVSSLQQYENTLKKSINIEQLKNIQSNDEKFEFTAQTNDNDSKENNAGDSENTEKPLPNSKERLNVFANIKFPAFSFGSTETTTGSSAPLFNFTDFKTSNFGKVDNSNLEIDNAEPPKNEFKPVVEDDSVYSKRCKVFVKHDGDYSDRGIGTLYLKSVENSKKTQLIVRADTNLGNILLNFILNESLPHQRVGKNNVMIVCIPTPESEQKPTSILIRVKTEEEADELFENINNFKK